MTEAQYQTQFGKYVIQKQMEGHFELKVGTKRVYLSKILPHQWTGLAVAKNGLYIKHSDADPRQKPCDCSYTKAQGYFVFIYKESNIGYIIPSEMILDIKDTRASITEGEADALSVQKVKFI